MSSCHLLNHYQGVFPDRSKPHYYCVVLSICYSILIPNLLYRLTENFLILASFYLKRMYAFKNISFYLEQFQNTMLQSSHRAFLLVTCGTPTQIATPWWHVLSTALQVFNFLRIIVSVLEIESIQSMFSIKTALDVLSRIIDDNLWIIYNKCTNVAISIFYIF